MACALSACQTRQPPWLEPTPAAAPGAPAPQPLRQDAFFEVPASKVAAAQFALREQAIIELPGAPARFGQPAFKCDAPSRIYLIRALYENGGTGAFSLY
jgi:hypothetical protein